MNKAINFVSFKIFDLLISVIFEFPKFDSI